MKFIIFLNIILKDDNFNSVRLEFEFFTILISFFYLLIDSAQRGRMFHEVATNAQLGMQTN